MDVAIGLCLQPADAIKGIENLVRQGLVEAKKTDGEQIHYAVTRKDNQPDTGKGAE